MNANSLLRAASFLFMIPILGIAQVRPSSDPVVLKHWAAPLYWQPRAASAGSQALDPNPLVFVAMTPCRVVDTRGSQGLPPGFGPPILVAGVSRTFPVQSNASCPIPATAQAYSFNITVVPAVPSGFITAYPTATGQPVPLAATLVWFGGSLTSNAAIVPGGTSGSVDVFSNGATDIVIDINGYYAPLSDRAGNTAVGTLAFQNNTTGARNTVSGVFALASNTTGTDNTASGYQALASNITGSGNSAYGSQALFSSTGEVNITGSNNTAIGTGALYNLTQGNNNIAIGASAAVNVGGSNNIHIGNTGTIMDNQRIRIGTPGTQTSFFAAGIRFVTTGMNDAVPVVIDSNGQLGTISSSRRYKEDIQDIGEASRGLMRLRPVTFRYQKPFADGSKPMQYGLIAEEVAEVFPDLVARSADGQIETVKYQVLDSLLLNEVQRQQAEITSQKDQILGLEEQINELKAAFSRFEMKFAPK
jgi:hypothetical protein